MSHPQKITPEYVLTLQKPTDGYLCPIQANTYGVEFTYFKIRNCDNDQVLCEITKPQEQLGKPMTENMRKIRYHFGPYFFHLTTIGTTLRFRVGDKPVKNFKMIQRHYFKDKLIKSYVFDSPFCMPGSTNEMQAMYQMPDLDPEMRQNMINSPWQTISDSFYFVQNQLIMHTKAEFNYSNFDQE